MRQCLKDDRQKAHKSPEEKKLSKILRNLGLMFSKYGEGDITGHNPQLLTKGLHPLFQAEKTAPYRFCQHHIVKINTVWYNFH